MAKARSKAAYMISAVAEQYQIHPQTLRLYEREGLLAPSRSEGNTRLYTDDDLERLEVILKLTRDLGVNLAGVEIILNMREKMAAMQDQIEEFVVHAEPGVRAPGSPVPGRIPALAGSGSADAHPGRFSKSRRRSGLKPTDLASASFLGTSPSIRPRKRNSRWCPPNRPKSRAR